MRIVVTAPGNHLRAADVDQIEKDLEKIDRRLKDFREEVKAEVRITGSEGMPPGQHVVLELHYGRNHLRATAEHTDLGQAVRIAREEILRQINDRSRRGHSSFSKHA